MAIIRKSTLTHRLKELDERYKKFRAELVGEEPNAGIYHQYHNNVEQYKQEFCEVDKFKVELSVSDFQTILKEFKNVDKFKAKKVGK